MLLIEERETGMAVTHRYIVTIFVILPLEGVNITCKTRSTCVSIWPSWSKAPVSGTGPKGRGFESHC